MYSRLSTFFNGIQNRACLLILNLLPTTPVTVKQLGSLLVLIPIYLMCMPAARLAMLVSKRILLIVRKHPNLRPESLLDYTPIKHVYNPARLAMPSTEDANKLVEDQNEEFINAAVRAVVAAAQRAS